MDELPSIMLSWWFAGMVYIVTDDAKRFMYVHELKIARKEVQPTTQIHGCCSHVLSPTQIHLYVQGCDGVHMFQNYGHFGL